MECRPTAPWRASLWRSSLAVLALALLTSCTTYIIQRPDGTLVRVDHPPDGLDPPDKDGSEPIIIEDEGLVIEVETSTEYVLSDGQQPVHLQVTVRAEEIEVVERAPLDLALVIDRSGSMRGTKLLQAKMAARQLIEHLHHGDRASIVSYAGDVRVDVPATVVDSYSRQQLTDAVDRLLASGQTFLSGGLEAGAAELRTRHQGERLHRVVLLSDGRANVGVVDRARLDRMAGRLYEEGISVTTMGLGVDYDEDLMTAIAVAGGGNYYFIEHPERLADVFERELNVLSTVISRDMILYLELMDGVVVEDVYGYRHEQRGRELRIPLSSVSSGQRRRLLMTLDVPPAAVGRQVIAQGRIDYRHEVQQARRSVRLSPVTVRYTRDQQQVVASANREVVEKLEMVRNAVTRQRVMRRLDEGDRVGAQRIVGERLQQSQQVHQQVGGQAIRQQIDSLRGLSSDVQSAPAAGTPGYSRMRKLELEEAVNLEQY